MIENEYIIPDTGNNKFKQYTDVLLFSLNVAVLHFKKDRRCPCADERFK